MGLIVKDLAEITEFADPGRSLYIYLLDYGWPDGEYERIFTDQWSKLSERASETGAIVIKSQRGVHFANSVLNWHSLAGREIEDMLPAIMLTKSPPSYFFHGTAPDQNDTMNATPQSGDPERSLDSIALLPLREHCESAEDFSRILESIFADLERGCELKQFSVCNLNTLKPEQSIWNRFPFAKQIGSSVLLQPNFMGLGVDLKKLFTRNSPQEN